MVKLHAAGRMRTQRSPTPRPATGAKPPGPRPAPSPAFRKVYQNRLKELGKVTFDRIEVELSRSSDSERHSGSSSVHPRTTTNLVGNRGAGRLHGVLGALG